MEVQVAEVVDVGASDNGVGAVDVGAGDVGAGDAGQALVLDDTNILITLAVSLDQEVAIRTFFQVNDWPLIEGEKDPELEDKDGTTRFLTLKVTPEQEAAMEAFFQINNWTLVKEDILCLNGVDPDESLHSVAFHQSFHSLLKKKKDELMSTQVIPEETVIQEGVVVDDNTMITPGTMLNEVTGVTGDEIGTIQVSTSLQEGQSQVIVYKEGQATVLPRIILDGDDGTKNLDSQIILQEISLPEARTLEQSLIIANSRPVTKRVTPRGTMRPGDKIHKCHVCGKTFKQSPSFNGHYQSHFGNKPHNCELCGTGFTLKAALVAHMSIHTGEKPFQCTVCLKRFRRKDDLLSHIRTHTGEKPYECEICGKKFKYRNQIPKHKRTHTGERPYKCSFCEKAFTTTIHLKRHERVHTGERPYKCEFCTKAFTQYGHLQAHIRIHTNERPYKCTICGRGFREKKVLKKHEAMHTSERPYKCETCGKGFLRKSNMELHSVMHQPGREGVPRPRPRPKKKNAADAEMREFVENVLSNVVKVETGMQTDNLVEVVSKPDNEAVDNLSAFVDFAVSRTQVTSEQTNITAQSGEDSKGEVITDNLGNQFTLVMQEDDTEGYIITMEPSEEQIVTSEQEIHILPTTDTLTEQVISATTVPQNTTGSKLLTETADLVNSAMDHDVNGEQDIMDTLTEGEPGRSVNSSNGPALMDNGVAENDAADHSIKIEKLEQSELISSVVKAEDLGNVHIIK